MLSFSERELQLLRPLYVELDVPSDQYGYRRADLDTLTERFNAAAQTSLGADELLRRLINARRKGNLPRLRRNYNGRHNPSRN